MTPRANRRALELAAESALRTVDVNASDELIATLIADSLLACPPYERTIHLSVLDPCDDLECDWKYKNSQGISTADRERARAWIVDATMAALALGIVT